MAVDRPSKHKAVPKRGSVAAKEARRKKKATSVTAEDLEALLHFLDKEERSGEKPAPKRKRRNSSAQREPRPTRAANLPSEAASSFMQELACARAELHKERRLRHALEAKIESLHKVEAELATRIQQLTQGQQGAESAHARIERLQEDVAKSRMELAASHEQLGVARLRLANADRDREHAQQREAEASQRANDLSEEIQSLKVSVRREAEARRKAEIEIQRKKR